MFRLVIALAVLVSFDVAQSPPRYEVSAIKPNKSGEPMSILPGVHGNFAATNATLEALVAGVFGVPRYRVSGASGWMTAERYDIVAKAGEPRVYSASEVRGMMQQLLQDRFRLSVHHETREMPIFALVVAKGGLKMHDSKEGDCYEVGPTTTPADLGDRIPLRKFQGDGSWPLDGSKIPISLLARSLQGLGRMVVDEAHLDGRVFDIDMSWTPQDMSAAPPADGQPDRNAPAGPGIFDALQTQLGLRLEPRRGPVDVVVIDHAERPGEN